MNIALAIAIVTVAGLLGSVILVLAAKFMAVEEDPRIGEVTSCLPGANCGACGYAGCADYAKAIVEGGAPVNKCVPGGAKAAADVAAVMGVEAGATAAVRATVRCQGKPGVCTQIFDYHGVSSCAAAAALYGGPKACAYGCLGLGDCVKACKFDAIHVVDGIAHVDPEKCTGCGACAAACPKSVIEMASDMEEKPLVLCHNTELPQRGHQGHQLPGQHRLFQVHRLRPVRGSLPQAGHRARLKAELKAKKTRPGTSSRGGSFYWLGNHFSDFLRQARMTRMQAACCSARLALNSSMKWGETAATPP